MDDLKLTPQEALLKSEGDAMLRAIQAQQPPPSPILGPDGQAVEKNPTIDPKTAMAQQRAAYEEQRKKQFEEMHRQMVELTEKDKEALDLSSVLLCCHRLASWARAELYARCGVDEDLVAFTDGWLQKAAEGDNGFTLKKAIGDMKHQALQIAEHFHKLNSAQQGKRLKRLNRILDNLNRHGFRLGTEALKTKMGGIFRPGEVLVLHGDAAPIEETLTHMARIQDPRATGKTYYLATSDRPSLDGLATNNVVVMPPTWWHDIASHIRKLYQDLKPVTDDEAALVLIEDLSQLYTSDPDIPAAHRKQNTIARLRQWAMESAVAVVVANIDPENPDPRFYGRIPYAVVRYGKLTDLVGPPSPYVDGIPLWSE